MLAGDPVEARSYDIHASSWVPSMYGVDSRLLDTTYWLPPATGFMIPLQKIPNRPPWLQGQVRCCVWLKSWWPVATVASCYCTNSLDEPPMT